MTLDQAEIDSIEMEVLRNALASIVDSMALTVMRTAHSGVVKDAMDYSTGLCDRDGTVIAQGLTIVLHLGSFPNAVAAVLRDFEGDINPGDVFILNDPYLAGGIHLPDIYVIRPVFHEDSLEAFAVVVAHHTDVGGIVPGSNSTDSTEIYQEGLRIPALKLFHRGEPDRAVHSLLSANVRLPDKVLGDLNAQVTAAATGARDYLALANRFGVGKVRRFGSALLDYAERAARNEIRAMPNGVASFTTYVDADNIEQGPVKVHATVTVSGDQIIADFDGTSEQVPAGINSPLPFSRAGVFGAVRLLLDPAIPLCDGYTRAITVVAPPGTVVNPVSPAACGARGITGFRVMECVLGALAQLIPDRVPADGEGGNSIISIGGTDSRGMPFGYVDLIAGARGGGPMADGAEGVPHPGANISSTSIEIAESELPIRIEEYEMVPDSGGAGKRRGAMAQRRTVRLLEGNATLQLRSDKRKHRPYGLQGGADGAPSSNVLKRADGSVVDLPTLAVEPMSAGDVIAHTFPSGAGWGHAFEREPTLVLNDVLSGKVSVEAAATDYGVVVNPETETVDEAGTLRLRSRK